MAEPLPGGIIAAVCTPFDRAGRPDLPKLIAHVERLRAEGCVGILLAGTTGEGQALGLTERREIVERFAATPRGMVMLVATGTASLVDTIGLTRHAVDHNFTPVLMAARIDGPVTDEGLIAYFSAVVEDAVPIGRQVVLYNLPQWTASWLSPRVLSDLVTRFGSRIGALKDSSGDRAYLHEVRRRLPDLFVYVGHEPLLSDAIRLGARGGLSGMANLVAPLLVRVADGAIARGAEVVSDQEKINAAWAIVSRHQPFAAAFKGVLAARDGSPDWSRTRPPLEPIAPASLADLIGDLAHALAGTADTPGDPTTGSTSAPCHPG